MIRHFPWFIAAVILVVAVWTIVDSFYFGVFKQVDTLPDRDYFVVFGGGAVLAIAPVLAYFGVRRIFSRGLK